MTSDGIHLKKNYILLHEEHINAIKMKIKPGFFSIFFKKFTFQTILDYFNVIKDNPVKNLN